MSPRPVALRPPLEVMRPEPVGAVPAEGAVPGGVMYQIKLDGFRALAFVLPEGPVLQARSGRDLAPRFPELLPALAALPVGSVLDGEVCAWHAGRFAFGELLRTPAARARDGAAVAYIAFDALTAPGGGRAAPRDIRGRPLAERWEVLVDLLRGVAPPIELVMATRDRAEAMAWFEQLVPLGVEGLIVKPLSGIYGGGSRWWKVRHTETVDGEAIALLGPPNRPRGLLVRLPDGRTVATTPTLNTLQAHQVAAVAAALLAGTDVDPEHGTVLRLAEPLAVELRLGIGRHATARFVRVRGD